MAPSTAEGGRGDRKEGCKSCQGSLLGWRVRDAEKRGGGDKRDAYGGRTKR